jgi:hypothetical protein
MNNTLQGVSLAKGRVQPFLPARGIGWGLLGGLAGTLVMDILLMGVLLAARQPALLCFSIVGDTVASFFAIYGVQMSGGMATGVAAHYVIGPLVGALFGAVMQMLPGFRRASLKKSVMAAIVYVEILSQPILATTPILLRMSRPVTLVWYGGSFAMHLVLAFVLGLVMWYGQKPACQATQKKLQ